MVGLGHYRILAPLGKGVEPVWIRRSKPTVRDRIHIMHNRFSKSKELVRAE